VVVPYVIEISSLIVFVHDSCFVATTIAHGSLCTCISAPRDYDFVRYTSTSTYTYLLIELTSFAQS